MKGRDAACAGDEGEAIDAEDAGGAGQAGQRDEKGLRAIGGERGLGAAIEQALDSVESFTVEGQFDGSGQ